MKKQSFVIILLLMLVTSVIGIAQNNQVLLNIEDEKITVDEFLRVYNKNNNAQNSIDPKSVSEYLELYINFKLKVKEAEAMGMDTAENFVKELNGNRIQLAKPYLTDQEKTDELLQEAYNRMKYDVRASHILIRVGLDALPSDTLKARARLNTVLKTIKNPEKDFGKVAAEMSEDPSAKQNFGDLGYFTAFQMVYPFETAAYSTKVGTISKPVRTRFGYHILYVHDKRPARGEIKTAHILVKTEENKEDLNQQNAQKKINEIYEKLKNGEDFASLARQFSDDKSSAVKGGELPIFGTGRMVPEFEEAAFALANNGDFSEPIKTQYGWHIIQRIEKIDIPSFEEVEKELKKKITRDGRSQQTQDSFVEKLKSEYNFKYNEKALKEMVQCMDDEFFEGTWNPQDNCKGKEKELFSVEDSKYSNRKETYTQADLAAFMQRNRRYERTKENLGQKEAILKIIFNKMVASKVMAMEEGNLEAKYPDFRDIIKEYRDGILLFELMDKMVWSKALKDTTGLMNFYEANKQNYMWPERVEAKIFYCNNEKLAKKARKMAKKQVKKGWTDDEIKNKLNADSQLNLEIRGGKYVKGENEIIDSVLWSKGLSENKNIDNQIVFVNIIDVMPPQPKLLDEARGIITADYQSYLEKEWIKELRNKYKFSINQQALKSINN